MEENSRAGNCKQEKQSSTEVRKDLTEPTSTPGANSSSASDPLERRYTVDLSQRQMGVLSLAAEVLARLGMGQAMDALEHLPIKPPAEMDFSQWHDDMRTIRGLLSQHMVAGIDGWQSSLGIRNKAVPPASVIAWDLHQVLRHRLAHDQDPAKEGRPRFLSVAHDTPYQIGDEPLARVTSAGPADREEQNTPQP